jgi:uncharacterized protein YutE (UPF0331/DUF86 family)
VIRPEVIRRRLAKLDKYLSFLERARQYTFEEFSGDPERYGSAERFLHLAIETVLDIGSHCVAEMNLGHVELYRDIPAILAREGWIDEELKDTWMRMVGFRNILVHDYLEVDRQIVYDVIQHELDDLRALQRVFTRVL